jgi:hypothetical protein
VGNAGGTAEEGDERELSGETDSGQTARTARRTQTNSKPGRDGNGGTERNNGKLEGKVRGTLRGLALSLISELDYELYICTVRMKPNKQKYQSAERHDVTGNTRVAERTF